MALVVPTLDEGDAIGPALRRVPRRLVDRIIVVDGGSRDATLARARAAGAETLSVGRGYGLACLAGAEAASDCDVVAFMDGDGADRPEVLASLVGPIAEGERDLVVGSRTRGMREAGSMGLHQVVAGRAVGRLLGLWFGTTYTDMGALRAIRRDALLALGMREASLGWNVEMQVRAARARLRVLEVPVPYGVRVGGRSKVAGSVRGTVLASWRIVAAVVRAGFDAAPEARPTRR